jgi:thiamine-monophosphate kinase
MCGSAASIGDGWLGLHGGKGGKLGNLSAEANNLLVSRYRVPEPPRLAFAELLPRHATASIDVSDGLVADAGHIAQASGVKLVIRAKDVPLSRLGALTVQCRRLDAERAADGRR